MNEIVIYSKCIDFNKKSVLNHDKTVIEKEKIVYEGMDVNQLFSIKHDILEKQVLLEEKMTKMYLREDKTKQKFCIYSQKKQEKLRSLKWVYHELLVYLEELIKRKEGERKWRKVLSNWEI